MVDSRLQTHVAVVDSRLPTQLAVWTVAYRRSWRRWTVAYRGSWRWWTGAYRCSWRWWTGAYRCSWRPEAAGVAAAAAAGRGWAAAWLGGRSQGAGRQSVDVPPLTAPDRAGPSDSSAPGGPAEIAGIRLRPLTPDSAGPQTEPHPVQCCCSHMGSVQSVLPLPRPVGGGREDDEMIPTLDPEKSSNRKHIVTPILSYPSRHPFCTY